MPLCLEIGDAVEDRIVTEAERPSRFAPVRAELDKLEADTLKHRVELLHLYEVLAQPTPAMIEAMAEVAEQAMGITSQILAKQVFAAGVRAMLKAPQAE